MTEEIDMTTEQTPTAMPMPDSMADVFVNRWGGTLDDGLAPPSRMTAEVAAALRAPFPASSIGKLPRTTCRQCSDSDSRVCQQHSKQKCDECNNYMTTAHIHLDYVGHAAVTDRLLHVDPLWTWEPVAFDPSGAPMIQRGDKQSRLWIRMTVCDVTRIGVGIAESWKQEVEKELISDAIRNAAMRFGVALDLWSREDLEHASEIEAEGPPAAAREAVSTPPTEIDRDAIHEVSRRLDNVPADQADAFKAWVKDQGFPWPWPKAACAVMLRRLDEITGTPESTPDPGLPETAPEGTLPPADGLPETGPCELCGSTRARVVMVGDVRRCVNANDCRKRVDAANAEADAAEEPQPVEASVATQGGAAPPPAATVPAEPTQEEPTAAETLLGAPVEDVAPAETGDETLYCTGCHEAILDELPVFGDADEPYHVACSPMFGEQ